MPLCLLILCYIDYGHMSLFKTAHTITPPRQARDSGRSVVNRIIHASLWSVVILPCVVCGHLVSQDTDSMQSLSHVILVAISTAFQCFTTLPYGLILCSVCAQNVLSACQVCLFHLIQLLPWCPATIYHSQAPNPAEQNWRECVFSVAGLAGIQGLVDSDLQFHLMIKRADGVIDKIA